MKFFIKWINSSNFGVAVLDLKGCYICPYTLCLSLSLVFFISVKPGTDRRVLLVNIADQKFF